MAEMVLRNSIQRPGGVPATVRQGSPRKDRLRRGSDPHTQSPWREMEAEAGIEPTYEDLQSSA